MSRANLLVYAGAAPLIIVAAVFAAGCGGGGGPARAHVSGSVSLDGAPLPADATGNISFVPAGRDQGKPGSAQIVGGKYDCLDAPQGAVRVYFSISRPTGPEMTDSRGLSGRASENIVPEKYSPGLAAEITGDDSQLDFQLEG